MIKLDLSPLNLQKNEELSIANSINQYAAPLSLKSTFSRICNAISSVFGKSDWQQAKTTLIYKGNDILKARLRDDSFDSKAFAEFTLRLLVNRK